MKLLLVGFNPRSFSPQDMTQWAQHVSLSVYVNTCEKLLTWPETSLKSLVLKGRCLELRLHLWDGDSAEHLRKGYLWGKWLKNVFHHIKLTDPLSFKTIHMSLKVPVN